MLVTRLRCRAGDLPFLSAVPVQRDDAARADVVGGRAQPAAAAGRRSSRRWQPGSSTSATGGGDGCSSPVALVDRAALPTSRPLLVLRGACAPRPRLLRRRAASGSRALDVVRRYWPAVVAGGVLGGVYRPLLRQPTSRRLREEPAGPAGRAARRHDARHRLRKRARRWSRGAGTRATRRRVADPAGLVGAPRVGGPGRHWSCSRRPPGAAPDVPGCCWPATCWRRIVLLLTSRAPVGGAEHRAGVPLPHRRRSVRPCWRSGWSPAGRRARSSPAAPARRPLLLVRRAGPGWSWRCVCLGGAAISTVDRTCGSGTTTTREPTYAAAASSPAWKPPGRLDLADQIRFPRTSCPGSRRPTTRSESSLPLLESTPGFPDAAQTLHRARRRRRAVGPR